MEISGKETFKTDIPAVWNALHDPEVLQEVIPGCQLLEQKENGEFDVVLKLGIAAVKGEYSGSVQIEDIENQKHYTLYAKGSGTPGHVDIKMDCEFSETEEGCLLSWECEAEIGGMIASVGTRVVGGVGKYIAGVFFKDLKKQLKQ